jgi:hypothetical protein
MILNNLTKLKDNRTNCYSLIFEMAVKDYLNLIEEIYKDKGGLKEQREPLKSSSAMRIRKQMVKDIKAGTVLPPIVLGLIVPEKEFDLIPVKDNLQFVELISDVKDGNLTIIDGMQRTTALTEALEEGASDDTQIRVEFWVSIKLNSLIYRMLVLNTGQVPWNLRRQVETIFSTMINEMKTAIPEMEVYKLDDANRRTQGGQYHANDLIELYLAFGGRKEKVDTKERLADEFTRLDFIEATENKSFADIFYKTLRTLAIVDIEFSKYAAPENENRFNNGKDLFKSQPARVGFITAISKKIYGRPGIEKPEDEITKSVLKIEEISSSLIQRLGKMNNEQLGDFLSLNTLSEKLAIKSSRVGDFEREFFTKSFDTLLDEGAEIPKMEVCWQSY